MAINLIVGGQFGSEGKGSFAHWFGKKRQAEVWCRAGGSQAGHSVNLGANGIVKLRQLPVGALEPGTVSLIGPGAIVDPGLLEQEIGEVEHRIGHVPAVVVDPGATVLEENHPQAERLVGLTERIGSTGEGVGAARADRIARTAKVVGDLDQGRWQVMETGIWLRQYRATHRTSAVVIEGTQGAGLSLFGPYYPYVTSASTHPAQIVADMGFPLQEKYHIMAVYRTFPIRVGGNSGDLAQETDWETLQQRFGDHIPVEETTVTGRTRRVGWWDPILASWSAEYMQPHVAVLTFLDYPFPEIQGMEKGLLPPHITSYVREKEHDIGIPITYVGTGFGTYLSKWEGGW